MNLRAIFSTPRTNVVSSVLTFPHIDTDGMGQRLRVKLLGREQGERNLPPFDSHIYDSIEQAIVKEIESEGLVQFGKYLDHQRTYSDRFSSAGLQTLITELVSVAQDANTEFETITRVGTGDLYSLKREVQETEQELAEFRQTHGLRRPAKNQGTAVQKWGVLVFILAVEALLNGSFLSKGTSPLFLSRGTAIAGR